MKFTVSYNVDDKHYYVNERRIDSDAATVAYFIRTMCKIPPAKRPVGSDVRAVCAASKFLRIPLTFEIT
ncbi:hypothetical protein [Rhizobium phage RHph_X2_24]|nr:hypothetical protein [Rhizobium phage RHph_X2_24]